MATLLTRRSTELSLHAGQISLPGGRVHSEDDSLEHTALREAREETGLDSTLVRLLGRLPTTLVSSGIEVTPIVGWMDGRPELVADPQEVAELFECPLSIVLDVDSYKQDFIIRDGIKRQFYFFEFNEYYIWGATAAMLRSLAVALSDRGLSLN